MENPPAEIRLHLYLRSTHRTAQSISECLGVRFDECHEIGQDRARNPLNEEWWRRNPKHWDEHWWILHEVMQSTYGDAYENLSLAIDRLLLRVEVASEQFSALAREGGAEVSIVIQCDGYPGMGLSRELVRRLGRLNLAVDFDLYCERECERAHVD